VAPVRVLVTGAGSGVGNGIVKALRRGALPVTVCCSDIAPLNVGLFRADEAVIWPKVESPGALEAITASLKALAIDVVLIGSEYDLQFFADNRAAIESKTGARIVVSPPQTIAVANDKWRTAEFFRANRLPFAETALPKDLAAAEAVARDWGYPVMLKPRSGTSSRHVHVIEDAAQLGRLLPAVPAPILQRLLDTPAAELKNEYTATVFKTADGDVLGPFVGRRTMRGGDSWNVEVDAFPDVHPPLRDIADRLPVMGTLNVQLIMTENGPVPFEINARFSGTTAVRAHFGFNDAEMAIRHFHLGESLAQPKIGRGMAFRYMEEVFVDGVGAADLRAPFPKGEVHSWF